MSASARGRARAPPLPPRAHPGWSARSRWRGPARGSPPARTSIPNPGAADSPSAPTPLDSRTRRRRRWWPRWPPRARRARGGAGRRSSALEVDAGDPATIHALHDDPESVEVQLLPRARHTTQHGIDEAADGRDLRIRKIGAQRLRELIEADAAMHPIAIAILLDGRWLRRGVVTDLTDDLFENVFEGHDARGAAELVHDDRDVRAATLEIVQLGVEHLRLRHVRRRADQLPPLVGARLQSQRDRHQVLREHDAEHGVRAPV